MSNNARSTRIDVSSDGKGRASQAGAVLLWETMRVAGLGRGLSEGLAELELSMVMCPPADMSDYK